MYTNQNPFIDLSNLNPDKILEFSFNFELLKYAITSLISNQQNMNEELSRLKLSQYRQQKQSGDLELKLMELKIKGAKSKEELEELNKEKKEINSQNEQIIKVLESFKKEKDDQISQKAMDVYPMKSQKYENVNTKGISDHEISSQTSNKFNESEVMNEISNLKYKKGNKSKDISSVKQEKKEKIENILPIEDLATKNDLEDINKKIESFINDINNINSSIQTLEQELNNLRTKNNEQNQENMEKNIPKMIEETYDNKIKEIKNSINNINNTINNEISQLKENVKNNYSNLEEKISKMNKEIKNIESSLNQRIENSLDELKKNNEKIKNTLSMHSEKLTNVVSTPTFNNTKKELEQKIEIEKKFLSEEIFEIKSLANSLKNDLSDHMSDTRDKDNIQNILRLIESMTGNINRLLEFKKQTEDKENRKAMTNNNKFIKIEQFNEGINNLKKLIENNKKEFSEIRFDIANFRDVDLTNKASLKDLKSLEDTIFEKIERLKDILKDNFVEKNMFHKNLRYIEYQTKHLIEENNKGEKPENWLLAKKPMNGHLCASCEAYLGELKPTSTSNIIYWNKYPKKNLGEIEKKIFKVNAGFSKILQMIKQDNNNERSKSSSLNLSKDERNNSCSQRNNKRKIPNLNEPKKEKVLVPSKSFVGDDYEKDKSLPKILLKNKNRISGYYSTKSKTIRNSENNIETQRRDDFYANLKDLEDTQQNENTEVKPKITKIYKKKGYIQEKTE